MDRVPFALMHYREVLAPVMGFVTKFYGQPVWLAEPDWPLSRSTGKPMAFVCQIAIDPAIFGETVGRMAYIFIADDPDCDTYDAESGENAVIVQPGYQYVATSHTADDLSLRNGGEVREFAVVLEYGEEPAYDRSRPGFDEYDMGYEERFVYEDKIGGSPHWVQSPEFPDGPGWHLLAQFAGPEASAVGGGLVYAFLSEDGASGKMVWQE